MDVISVREAMTKKPVSLLLDLLIVRRNASAACEPWHDNVFDTHTSAS